MSRRVVGWSLVALVVAVGLAFVVRPFFTSGSVTSLAPSLINIDHVRTAKRPLSPTEAAQQAAVAHANRLESTSATAEGGRAYADCKAGEIIATQFADWQTRGQQRVDALNSFLTSDRGLVNFAAAQLTRCLDHSSGEYLDRDSTKPLAVHEGAIRQAMWDLVPLAQPLVEGNLQSSDVKALQAALASARGLLDAIETRWSAYQRLSSEPSLASIASVQAVDEVRAHVAALKPSAALLTAATGNRIDEATVKDIATRLASHRVKPWVQIDAAVKGLERNYEQLKTKAHAAMAKAADEAASLLASTTTRYVLGRGTDHCIVGDLRHADGGELALTLSLLTRTTADTAQPDCLQKVEGDPTSVSWRHLDLGMEYVSVQVAPDGALILPRGPRPNLSDVPAKRASLLRDLILPRWTQEAGSQWDVSGNPLDGTLKVDVRVNLIVPSLSLTAPVKLQFGQDAPTLEKQVAAVIEDVRGAMTSIVAEKLAVSNLPFRIARLDAADPSSWNRTTFAVQAQIDVPGLGNGLVRLELAEQRLTLVTQTLSDEWRTSIARAAERAIRERLRDLPSSADLSVAVIDGRIEPPGALTATVRFAREDSAAGALPELKIRVTPDGLDIAPTTGTLAEVVGRVTNQATQAVVAGARDYARAIVTRAAPVILAGLNAVPRTTTNPACSDGFDLVIDQSFGVQCVVALDANEIPKLDFSRARLVTLPAGTSTEPSQLILRALGVGAMQVGRLRTSSPVASAEGLRFAVFLDGIPRLDTVQLGEVVLGPGGSWRSDLPARFTEVLRKELSTVVSGVLKDQLGPVQLVDVRPEFRADGISLSTNLIATLDVSGTPIPIAVKATWLPRFSLEKGAESELFANALQGVVGKFLEGATGSDLKPINVTLDPLGVIVTPRVKIGELFSISVTLHVTRDGVKAKTPVEFPVLPVITIPPVVAIVNVRLRLTDEQLKGVGVAGAVTAVSPGVDTIAKIEAVFDLQREPIRAEFSGSLILLSVIPLANVHALFTPDQFDFDIATSGIMNNVLSLRGHGNMTRDRMFANGSIGVLGVSMSDGRIEVILCERCTDRGRVSAGGSVNLLLGRAGATIDFSSFPSGGRFRGTVGFQVDRFSISDATVLASEEGASIDFRVFNTSLRVAGRSLADLSPARVLDAILAIFKMDPQKLLEALKNPSFTLGAPVGPQSAGGTGDGQNGGAGGASSGSGRPGSPPSNKWITGGTGGSSQQPTLRPGAIAIAFQGTNYQECVVRQPYRQLIPNTVVDLLKKNLTIAEFSYGWNYQVGSPETLTADGQTVPHLFAPPAPGRATASWAVTVADDGSLDAVRMHVTQPCGSPATETAHVVRLPITTDIFASNWNWQAARIGQSPYALSAADHFLIDLALQEAVTKAGVMTTPTSIDLGEPGRVYAWQERGPTPDDQRLALMSRSSFGPARFSPNSILKDLADPQVRQSWPWWPIVADGFIRGFNPTFLWPATGTPQFLEIGPLLWFCPPSSPCQPVRKLQPLGLSALSDTQRARVDQLLGHVSTMIAASPPPTSTANDVRAALWIGMPTGSSVPVALYSPDLTQSAYQVFVVDTAVRGPFSQTTIQSAAKVRALECQQPEPTLGSIDARVAFFQELSHYPPQRTTCMSPWFFWKSLKNP